MIVMKFGGTSVQDAESIRRVASIVGERMPKHPVVVISAVGKTTRNLLEAARVSVSGDLDAGLRKLDAVQKLHEILGSETIDGWGGTEAKRRIDGYFDDLHKLLDGLSILGELSPRSQDKILSYGELMSSSILDAAFKRHGLPSVWLDARKCILTDERFTAASPILEETDEAVRKLVQPVLLKNQLPLLQGYIGASKNGATTTLGFEGSDFSAALVGAALEATEIQIWKDVPGVMTADPEMVPEARTVRHVTFEEAAHLTFFGAKVLHPKSIEPARKRNIPVTVCNSKNPGLAGSTITSVSPRKKAAVISIAYKKPLQWMRIQSNMTLPLHAFYQAAMETFTRVSIAPLVFSTAENTVTVVVEQDAAGDLRETLERFAHVAIQPDKAAVTLVGEGIRSEKRLAEVVLACLKNEAVHVLSVGSSETGLTVLTDADSVTRTLNILHSTFFKEWDPALFT
ncbi:MAG TPA: aspartate kinase [bacterium]